MYKKSARLKFSPLKIDKNIFFLKKNQLISDNIYYKLLESAICPFLQHQNILCVFLQFFLNFDMAKKLSTILFEEKKINVMNVFVKKKNNCAILIFVFWNIPSHSICCCYKISMCWIKQKLFWLKIWNPKS